MCVLRIKYLICQRIYVSRISEFANQFIRYFIVGSSTFLLHFLTDFHREMSQSFPDLFCFSPFTTIQRRDINGYLHVEYITNLES